MAGIINCFKWLIECIKNVFSMFMSIFSTIGMVFKYLISIVDIAFEVVGTFPDWLKAFAIITLSISIAYFVIGRNAGKSD